MTTLVDTLPIIHLSTDVSLRQLLSKNDLIIDANDKSIDRYVQSRSIHGNVCSGGIIVLWFGEKDSSLRAALIKNLAPEDITLILFSTEEQLWYWLNTYSSQKVASLIIQTNINIENIVRRGNAHTSIRSILIRCSTNELITLQPLSRTYIKVDGIFTDDARLLTKLVIDLALLSEEMGDQHREDENNELYVQRNYDRALKLCALARKL